MEKAPDGFVWPTWSAACFGFLEFVDNFLPFVAHLVNHLLSLLDNDVLHLQCGRHEVQAQSLIGFDIIDSHLVGIGGALAA